MQFSAAAVKAFVRKVRGSAARTERAAYVLAHFWDSMDFSDTSRSLDTAFMEQNFANFASLLPHVDADAVSAAAESVLKKAASCRTSGREDKATAMQEKRTTSGLRYCRNQCRESTLSAYRLRGGAKALFRRRGKRRARADAPTMQGM